MSVGRVFLVGAGPGDPGLLTLRGKECLEQAEVVVYDALIADRLLDHAPPEAERIYVGKRAAAHTLSQDGINRLLVEKALAGRTIVRLKGGDPYVFGRGGEEALALAEAGIPFEVVPGVTAAVAASAYAGIPVTHRGLAVAVGLVTGHEADDKEGSDLDWDALARWPGTLAFYMGVRNLPSIARNLIAHGRRPETPAAAIRWGTTPQHRVVAGTLETLPDRVAAADLRPPALIIVGEVVGLRDRLGWFEARPLLGRRIVVTRSRAQASDVSRRLESLGAEVIEAPAIRIEPPDDVGPLRAAVRSLSRFNWVVLTSTNGVDALFQTLAAEGMDARALAPCKVASIGASTTQCLAARGIRADLEPETFTGASLAEAMIARGGMKGANVLLARADIAPKDLPDALAQAGAVVHEVVAYRTVRDMPSAAEINAMLARGELDWLTFTSSSTVRYFVEGVPADTVRASRARIASIGPTTSATLRDLGLEPTIEADPHTIPGLVDALLAAETRGKT